MINTTDLITVICGGTGSVKLLRGLQVALGQDFTVIANIGDNIWLYGLYICPDIDTVLYGLSNLLDEERGWGIRGDTFSFLERYGEMGEESWFRVGDKDLATHILRTRLLGEGRRLSSITSLIAERLGIRQKVIPATDDPLETMVISDGKEMHLQEFWVKRGGEPTISGVRYKGIERAEAAEGVVDSILKSERIIIAPGNPISSIGPTISIREVAESLRETKAKKIAVSPVVGNSTISGPGGAMMRALGYEISATGVARYYSGFLDTLVMDKTDEPLRKQVRREGVEPCTSNIIMKSHKDEDELARVVLEV